MPTKTPVASCFHRFVRRFQKHSLLWIQRFCLPWRDAEELRVELINPVQKSALLGYNLAGCVTVRRIIRLSVPAVGGDGADRVHLAGKQGLQIVQGADPTRIAQAAAHNGNWLRLCTLGDIKF